MPEGLPELTALRLDASTRRSDGGRTLIGGSPLRFLRLSDTGARIVDDLAEGAPVGSASDRQQVARRLLDAGLAHPIHAEAPPTRVTVVVPVRDHTPQLEHLLDAIVDRDGLSVVVVDDGSANRHQLLDAVSGRAPVLHHDESRGPAAARNTGWRSTSADVIAFVDADTHPSEGWLEPLVRHLADPSVVAVAPRIRARRSDDSVLHRYEEHRAPLDLGPLPARVVPRGRVSYVPSAAVVYRRSALEELGGFDEALRVGEDVDLVWRTVAAGHTVRYEPSSVVTHDVRGSWSAMLRQRVQYGSSAAVLDQRHPGQVAPVELNAWTLLAWSLAAVGGPRGAAAGALVGVGSTAALLPKLRPHVDDPVAETLRLAGLGNLWAGRWLSSAVARAWLPVALGASVASGRARRATLAALVVPNLIEWRERQPDLDPLRWTAARIADDAASCAGTWRGCARVGSWRALRPTLTGIPGLTDRRR